jgi:hypothetical protein
MLTRHGLNPLLAIYNASVMMTRQEPLECILFIQQMIYKALMLHHNSPKQGDMIDIEAQKTVSIFGHFEKIGLP